MNIRGDAWTHKPNIGHELVDVGDVVLMKYDVSHVALVVGFEGSVPHPYLPDVLVPEFIYIHEANYARCKVTDRKIPFFDEHIKGFLRT